MLVDVDVGHGICVLDRVRVAGCRVRLLCDTLLRGMLLVSWDGIG